MITITAMQCSVKSANPNDTESLAEKIGQRLKGGEVIELVSDLGGGKTTFVRGLAKGFGSEDKVASPTFTVSKVYKAGKRELHHFDFYRLPDAGILAHEVHELIGEPDIVVAIEWAGAVHGVLPKDRLTVTFTQSADDRRELEISCPKDLDYLVEGLC